MRRACHPLSWPWLACALLLASARADAAATVEMIAPGVCPSMDIRNFPENISALRDCRVIEGQLTIVLMERATPKVFENISFPELREVTDYILIYRWKGVQNLGDLFPNLAVIRGMQLYKDFALVVFDNENLESLGLRSLMKIERGGVRIQQNDRLCYINTIDWSKITSEYANNVIRLNYDTRLCGLCPNAQGRIEDHRQSDVQCPSDANGRLLCWDDKHCQKICLGCGDRGCMDNGQCCHQACLGGCSGPTAQDCHVCRNFSFGDGNDRKCVDSCPIGTYKLSHRCVTEEKCRRTKPPLTAMVSDVSHQRTAPKIEAYKIYQNRCIYVCPSGTMEKGDKETATCEPCPETGCIKECAGDKIDSIAVAEQFRGCTRVKGKLEIALRATSGNTLSVLESSLGEIREITGSLHITRAYPLVSLMFLKKLRKITGYWAPDDKNKGQVLRIFNNQNLELLWDWSTHGPLDISGGSLFIHLNPKLCYHQQILPLQNMTHDPRSSFSDNEVSMDNNGNQASCLPDKLHLKVAELKDIAVLLSWNMYCPEDSRKLLGYSVYYMPTENNVTLYEQRDVCSDVWNVLDRTVDELQFTDARNGSKRTETNTTQSDLLLNPCRHMPYFFCPLSPLIPYTRYAAYVKTYTTLQEKKGAQSSIIYFRTLPKSPSPPLGVTAKSLSPHSVYIKWSPPTMPNGTITKYHVEIQANSYNKPMILAANTDCANPGIVANTITIQTEETPEVPDKSALSNVTDDTCKCKEEIKPRTKFNSRVEEDRMETINFENDLQNLIYRKREGKPPKAGPSKKTKRSVDHSLNSMLVKLSEHRAPIRNVTFPNSTDHDGYVKAAYIVVDGSTTSVTVDNMRHFTWYTVSVWACRAKDENEKESDYDARWCSEKRGFQTFRTSELVNADVVSSAHAEVIVSNKTLGEVNVTWKPPKNPNGFVIAYAVHYSRVGDSLSGQSEGLQSCVKADGAPEHSLTLRNLPPGNYSIEVTPITVAGAGNTTLIQPPVFIPERSADSGYGWVWGLASACLILAMMAAGGAWCARRHLLPQADNNKLFASVNPEYVSTMYVPDEWEVPRANIEFIRELGQGSFGMVYEGIAKNIEKGKPETRCAVKTVNEHATDRERQEFLNEACVMKAFDTFHVVRLLGVVSRGQPTLVIMELMEFGDLKTYLRSHRPDAEADVPRKGPAHPPTLDNIMQMAIEIADGMAYLSAKKFVHRDLAARNCMVAGDLTVKVGDFGMTRDIYETDYYRKGTKGLLPVRWMSPESLKDGVFSSSTDVWSYGVVLWEMATLAMQPYQGLSNEQVVRYVVEGGVMERPEHCPDRLYELMRACWAHRPAQRPSFLQLVADLARHAGPHFRARSFFHTPQGQEMYALQRTNNEEEGSGSGDALAVGAVATGSGSNLFGVSGRLASWVRSVSLRSRADDAAAEPLQPLHKPLHNGQPAADRP